MKKGIALATLVVIILVMILLISVITVTGFNTSNTTRKLAFASEIKMVQESVNSYRTANQGELPTSDFVVINLNEASEFVLNQFEQNGEEINEESVYLNKIDFNKITVKNLTKGIGKTSEDIYAVSSKTGIIYYVQGLKIGGKTYYSLTDDLKKLLKYNSKSSESNSKKGIVFEPETTDWVTGGGVLLLYIKVPNEYTLVSIKLKNGNTVLPKSTYPDGDYMIHSIELRNNEVVKVIFKDETNEEKNATYNVTNFDVKAPTLSIDSITTVGDKKYIKITCKDDDSKIKYLKYEYGNISTYSKEYFYNGGYEIKDNLIEVDSAETTITIYTEDNAGNNVLKKVNL